MTLRMALLLAGVLAVFGCEPNGEKKNPVGTTTQKPFAQRIIGVPGLENFARINTNLYRGAQPTEEGFKQLKQMGVKTVIDFRSFHTTREQVEAAGLTSVEIPIRADLGSTPPTREQIQLFFKTVLDPAKQPCYVHCAFGKDRTGTMCALYRLEMDGWTPEEAMQEMQAFGYHEIYRDFIEFIRNYKPQGYGKGR